MAIPVTVLSGSLGAGKTTLLTHLLENAGERDIAVLVNDMGEVNVDADLLENVTDGVAELSNGCVCCELRDDLERAVVRLARDREFDHLVVESSGISEPGPVARLFTTGSSAAARYDLDALVTVVDAGLFYDTFGSDEVPERRGTEEGDGETRPLSDLLVEQVEFSNLVVLNKRDLVSAAELERVAELVGALRPDAEIVRTSFGRVDPDVLLGRGLCEAATAEGAGWKRRLEEEGGGPADDTRGERAHADEDDRGDHAHGESDSHDRAHSHGVGGHDHAHPEEVYGVTSFTYRRRRPFHPERVGEVLAGLPAAVVRSKGTCWIAGRDDLAFTYSQAGPSARIEATGRWVASLPEFEQEAYRRNRSDVAWDDEWGDRRTELVFIGTGVDREALVGALDDCLLTDAEMDADWDGFENPYPVEQGGELVLAEPAVEEA